MIGQLHKNFRKFVSAGAILASLSAGQAFAETVSGRLIYADWYVLVKDEAGVQTVMARGERWPAGPRPVMVHFNINENAQGDNNLYIIAGSNPNDGQEPFLAASLIGSKTLKTGDSSIEVFQSDYTDLNAPTNPIMIKEIINGDMGGGTFTPSAPVIYGTPTKSLGTSTVPAIWFEGQQDNGHAVVFRIPFNALLDPITETASESGGNSSGPTNLGDKEREDLLKVILEEQAQTRFQTNRANSLENLLKMRDEEIISLNTDIEALKTKIKILETGSPAPSSPALLWSAIALGLGGLFGFLLGRRRKSLNQKPSTSNATQIEKGQAKKSHQPLMQETVKTWPDISLPAGEARGMMPRVDMPIPPRNVQLDYSQKSGFISSSVLVPEKKDNEITLFEKKYPEERPNYNEPYIVINKWHGMALPGSAMVAGQALLPDPILHLQTAYNAVGRIGFAQSGKAIGEDRNLGTGILIADQYIITNGHVWDTHSDMFKVETELGIEFHGEKNSAKSDFYEFDKNAQATFIPETDAIILKLKRKVPRSKRKPIHFSNTPTKDMKNREVIVVGYPSEPEDISEEEIKAMGHDDIFNVKRYSEGKLMLHPSDDDQDMLIETRTSGSYNTPPKETISAICHTASTLEGSSGSAVLCKETGELLALHFGYDMFFDYMDDDFNFIAKTNLAIPGLFLSDIVTLITSELEKAA